MPFLEATEGSGESWNRSDGTMAHVHQLCGLEGLPDLSELRLPPESRTLREKG